MPLKPPKRTMTRMMSRMVPSDMKTVSLIVQRANERLANRGSVVASSHATNKPADAKRRECHGVRPLLDGVANIILCRHGALPSRLGGVRDVVLRLAIQVLSRSGRLIDDPFSLRLGIAGHPTEAFLRLAAEISCGTHHAIFVHWSLLF